MTEADGVAGDLVCPRCGAGDGPARFYGPCEACRSELRAKFGGRAPAVAVEREAYEPKANVTPNFVATKE
jgi:hypothetical protein